MKNSIVIAWDFDDAGRTIGQSVLADDIQHLFEMSGKIDKSNDEIANWCISKGGKVVSKGGDQGIAIFTDQHDEEAFVQEMEQVRAKFEQDTGMTMTIGAGLSLSQAGKALLAGKLTGKDQIFIYDSETDDIVAQAHQHAQDGSGSEEENKLDEQYIDDMGQDEVSDEDQDPEMMDDQQDSEMFDDQMMSDDQEFSDESQEPEASDEDMLDEDASKEGVEQNPDIDGLDNTDEETESEDLTDEDLLEQNSLLQDVPEDDQQVSPEDEYSDEQLEDYASEDQDMDQDPEMMDDQQEFSDEEIPQEDPSMMEDVMMAPEDQEQDFSQEEEIQIPEAEQIQDQEDEQNLEDDTEKDEQDPNQDFNTFNSMIEDSSSQDGGQLKQQCAQVLSSFKEQKQNLEAMAEQAPELYQATLSMLQCMIEMSKALFSQPEDMPQEEQVDIPDAAEESQIPKQ